MFLHSIKVAKYHRWQVFYSVYIERACFFCAPLPNKNCIKQKRAKAALHRQMIIDV